jgi:hypothetical protein
MVMGGAATPLPSGLHCGKRTVVWTHSRRNGSACHGVSDQGQESGVLKRLLKWLEWVGHGANVWSVAGWLGLPTLALGLIGWAVTFFSSAVEGWSYTAVWLGSLAAGTALALIWCLTAIGYVFVRYGRPTPVASVAFDPSQSEHKTQQGLSKSDLSISAELSTAAMSIDGLAIACAIKVENKTGEHLHEKCLVKLLEMSCPWPESMPQDFVLRTESQIHGRRSGRFNLAVGDKKTVPILFQDKTRKNFLILIDENIDSRTMATKKASKHYVPFPTQRQPKLEIVIETSGAAVPGRYLLTLTKGPNWTISPVINQTSANYVLDKSTR